MSKLSEKRPTLDRRVQEFYKDYHKSRPRRPDQWLATYYWSQFIGSVLEVGAGTLLPESSPDRLYVALDITQEAATRAHQAGHTALLGDGQALPFRSASFDTVACYDVLEHVVAPALLLAEVCRVARRRVVIAGPNYFGDCYAPGLDRHLPQRVLGFVVGRGRDWRPLPEPHLTFDADWTPDRDAISATNVSWVALMLESFAFHPVNVRSWSRTAYRVLDHIPVVKSLGPFMSVVAEAGAQ